MLVRESISFRRYKDPKEALFGKKFGETPEEAVDNILKIMNDIILSSSNYIGNLKTVENVWFSQMAESLMINIVTDQSNNYKKELINILTKIGIIIIGKMIKGWDENYAYYEFPIKNIFKNDTK